MQGIIEVCRQHPALHIGKNTDESKLSNAPAVKKIFLFAGDAGADLEYVKPVC